MEYQKIGTYHQCDVVRIGVMVFSELYEDDFKRDYDPGNQDEPEAPGEIEYETFVVVHNPTKGMLFAISKEQAIDMAMLMDTKYLSDCQDLLWMTDNDDIIH